MVCGYRFSSPTRLLVNECYPKLVKVKAAAAAATNGGGGGASATTSAANAEPDSNGLGKLVFFTKSRPIKLAKVAQILLNSKMSPTKKREQLITLTILRKLLDECRSEVNVFADESIEIIARALRVDDEDVLEKAADAFYSLAILSPELDYANVLSQFASLSVNRSSSQKQVIGLHALDGVVSSEIFYGSDFQRFAGIVVPALLKVLEGVDSNDLDDLPDSKELLGGPSSSSTATGAAASAAKRPAAAQRARSLRSAQGLYEKPPSPTDVARHAYRILHTAFQLSHPRHIDELCEYCKKQGPAWLTGRYVRWTPAQYRFAVINFWNEEAIVSESAFATLVDLLSPERTPVINVAINDVVNTIARYFARDENHPLATRATGYLDKYPGIVDILLMNAREHPPGGPAEQGLLKAAERISPGSTEAYVHAMQQQQQQHNSRIINGTAGGGGPVISVNPPPSTASDATNHQQQQQSATMKPIAALIAESTSSSSPMAAAKTLSASIRSRPASVGNVSLADLRQSLAPSVNTTAESSMDDLNHHHPPPLPGSSGSNNANQHHQPTNGGSQLVNGHGGSTSMLEGRENRRSRTSSLNNNHAPNAGSNGSPEKKTLDKLVGNIDRTPHRMTSLKPPYELS